ncbi:hypothetical protein Pla123a_28170 [Posidoniimonas polymericola]|uniref:Cytochrome C n=1 Tax=Posidoniimonas polymericola TaxID=2528002 RepID=A0A5C5YM41_9BACT|nr:cytochrome c [Posidoniimonas polymericola]TWT76031.1 hypothetical protein Pla123a_28170 [Posidoniimonas polymericola]
MSNARPPAAFRRSCFFLACLGLASLAHGSHDWAPQPVAEPALPNAMWLTERVISGGSPVGDEGFAALKRLGVNTVLSVDGARPDIAAAKRHGLAYVHLPHGYDGIPAVRAKELSKAVADLPGPIYIHCHHGKHRSPAAAAVACIGVGKLSVAQGSEVLAAAGASPRYIGLFASVRAAERFDRATLDALSSDFPEVSEPPLLVQSMIDLEHASDRVAQIQQSGWQTPANHPDLAPAHEGLLLREHYTELLRLEEAQAKPEGFRKLAQQGEEAAARLEDALRQANSERQRRLANDAYAGVTQNCRDCHARFRDVSPASHKVVSDK